MGIQIDLKKIYNLLIFFPLINKTEIAYLQELNESLKDRFDVKSSYKSLHNKYLNMQKDEREQNEKVLLEAL